MDQAYSNLLASLEKNTVCSREGNLEVAIKPIPDSDRSGELDPRVFEMQKNMPGFSFAPVEGEDLVTKLRSMVGFPNRDVTTTDIQTAYREIEGTNGTIRIRIYSSAGERLPILPSFMAAASSGAA
jgi:acetyl esterase